MKRGLFLKYVTLFVGLVAVVGVINAALDLYFVYRDNRQASINVQREKAVAAAQTIESFVKEIERQIGWVAYAQFDSLPADQRRFDYVRLLRQVPAITELAQLDRTGHEQLHVSRLSMDVVGSNLDRSAEAAFIEAKANKVYYGPVYFRKGSEPYLTMAVAHGGRGGVTVADVNLKLIWDVVSQIRIGQNGYAYVIDRQGRLVAHPDISLVLRGTDMSKLAQVEEVLQQPADDTAEDNHAVNVRNRNGVPVLSAHAVIQSLNWIVFVELPTVEARQPVINAGLRDLALLVLGLLIAGGAAALLARRMVVPIRAMQQGAQRVGEGDLAHRISIKTGDELEALANQFNRSTEALQESYETLEQRVDDRTRELSESLEQQTATAGVLQVISASPTDTQPVFDVIAESALRLLKGWSIAVWRAEDDGLHLASARGGLPGSAEMLRRTIDNVSLETLGFVGDAIRLRSVAQIIDSEAEDVPANVRAVAKSRGWRSNVAVPMLREGEPIGVFSLSRSEPGTFSERELRLLRTFADQAVIAIQNVRLFTDLRETLEQQTATAEILQVISQSPTDVKPVLKAVASAARRFCGADDATIILREGNELVMADHDGSLGQLLGERIPVDSTSSSGRAVLERRTIHFPDIELLDPVEYRTAITMSRRTNVRAVLSAPMVRENEAIGTILLRKPTPGPFAPRQIELAETFAAQAVIAIQNGRLFTELSESLEQQTATAEILRVINASPGDLTPVFQTILAKAHSVCGADMGSLFLWDGTHSRAVVTMGYDAEIDALLREPRLPTPGTAELIAGQRFHHRTDLREMVSETASSYGPRFVAGSGIRTNLMIPLRKDGTVLGFISANRREVRPYSDKEIALLENFAAQAVIAMENARLLTELRESLEQQTATADILHVISQSPTDVQPVLDAVVNAALRFSGAEDAVIVLREGDETVVAAHEGTLSTPMGLRRRAEGGSITSRVISTGKTLHIPDIDQVDRTEFANSVALSREHGWRSAFAVPMLREGTAVGAIMLRKTARGPFSPRQIEMGETFAAQAVIAIENVRLFTEIQEKSRQLEIASQHKSQFLANMSHELRTPLNAILGYTEMMVDGLYGDLPEKAQTTLERVQANGKHLLGLINDVLDLSKIEAGQLSLAIEEYSVPDMVSTVMSATESLAKTKGISLVSELPQGLPRGHGDARRLTQVLLNLVGNAIKFTDQGKVEIRARQQDNRFKISVIDTGPGIAKADQAKIFEEFQQVDNTSTRKKGGTGLGLSISRKIVELHGGYITVESEPGKGSNFKITIPITAAPIKETAQ